MQNPQRIPRIILKEKKSSHGKMTQHINRWLLGSTDPLTSQTQFSLSLKSLVCFAHFASFFIPSGWSCAVLSPLSDTETARQSKRWKWKSAILCESLRLSLEMPSFFPVHTFVFQSTNIYNKVLYMWKNKQNRGKHLFLYWILNIPHPIIYSWLRPYIYNLTWIK